MEKLNFPQNQNNIYIFYLILLHLIYLHKLLNNNHLVIVDVGASGGILPRWSKRSEFYKGILFEPDPREFDALKKNSDSNLIVINSALSLSLIHI